MFKKLLGLDSSQEIDQWELAFRGGPFLGILLIVAAIAFAIFLYRREQLVTRNRRITMIALQAAVLLLLILVLMQPYAKIRTSNESKRSMIVMLDTSRSMAIQDPRTAASDVEEAAKALGKMDLDAPALGSDDARGMKEELGSTRRIDLARAALANEDMKLLDQLEESYDLRFFTFDSQLRSEDPRATATQPADDAPQPAPLPVAEGISSQIGNAIEDAVDRFSGQPLAGAMVISDFAWVEGKDPVNVARRLKERRVPLYTVPVGLPAPPDINVRGVIAPEVVFKGDRVPLRVKIESRGFAGKAVQLYFRVNEDEKESKQVTLKNGVQFEEFMFIPEAESGTLELSFEIKLQEGEITEVNNATAHRVRILDEKIKVLYVEGMPRWEFRYLRWVLLRDPRLQVQFLMTQGDPALAASSPLHIGRFPEDPKVALQYDLIILGDVSSSYFNAAQTQLIEKLVRERGGSLLMLAGPMAAPSTYRDNPIGDLLPINIGTGGTFYPGNNISPEVTEDGQKSLATSLSLSPDVSARIWRNVNYMSLPNLAGAKSGATVLLRLPKANDAEADYPLVAWHRYGTGKSLFVATEDLWRMRLEVGDRFHARFWGQTIQFLTLSRLLGANKQISIETDSNSYGAGDQIRVFANVLTESFEPVEGDSYEVVLEEKENPDSATTIEMTAVESTPGLYAGSYLAGKDGNYEIKTQPQDADISNVVEFSVQTVDLEDRETAMQPDVARQAAEISGGRQLSLASLGDFPSTLPEETLIANTVKIERDLWDTPLWFILIAALAGAEWFLRRKDNLV
ncbi:MAG: hypothetical protein DBX00_09765 [Verrucomicrobia bacterium]|nr:MAG: hypothetical protein DBX00_09765 [Verrucomicrobiota bacterium]